MGKRTEEFEEKFDNKLAELAPKGKEAVRANTWLGAVAATMATGFYTYLIDWNPMVRTAAHLAGAFAIPAGGAFVSSLAMKGIEGVANLGINLYNKKHPENVKEPFEINPKVKSAVKFLSTAAVGILYTYGTLGTEVTQFQNSGIFQLDQYLADIGGSAAGIFAFNKLDAIETGASFMQKVRTLSKAIVKPINALEDKIKGRNNPEKNNEILVEQEPEVDNTIRDDKEEVPVWDLSLYENSPINNPTQKEEHNQVQNIDSNRKIDIDDELNR